VLKQLALDDGHTFPAAVPIIENSIYVDETFFGSNDITELRVIRDQLIALMKGGGFQLRKWAANSQILLDDSPNNHHELTNHILSNDETLKILGLSWSPRDDIFGFVIASPLPTTSMRRSILSFIAKLYDPLGWAAPVVISAKMLLQQLWLLKNDWDAPIPSDISQRWEDCANNLSHLESVRIPRWTGQHQDNSTLEIHGFADASNRACGVMLLWCI